MILPVSQAPFTMYGPSVPVFLHRVNDASLVAVSYFPLYSLI